MYDFNSIEELQNYVLSIDTTFDCQDWGNVRVKRYGDLLQFNYNRPKQWTYFERISRGLILNRKTGAVVARPFAKFFNWKQRGLMDTTRSAIKNVYEKYDGSLGILYRLNGEYKIATRGSLDGNQAVWATEFLNANYDLDGLPETYTLLFEIIYPENRIILDYGDKEDLILLAIRDMRTGKYYTRDVVEEIGSIYGFTVAEVYTDIYSTEQLQKDVQNSDVLHEGFVTEHWDGNRYKFKSAKYFRLSKIKARNLTDKDIVLEAIQRGEDIEYLEGVDKEVKHEVFLNILCIIENISLELDFLPHTRKEFAKEVLKHSKEFAYLYFAVLDDKNIIPMIAKDYDNIMEKFYKCMDY